MIRYYKNVLIKYLKDQFFIKASSPEDRGSNHSHIGPQSLKQVVTVPSPNSRLLGKLSRVVIYELKTDVS